MSNIDDTTIEITSNSLMTKVAEKLVKPSVLYIYIYVYTHPKK